MWLSKWHRRNDYFATTTKRSQKSEIRRTIYWKSHGQKSEIYTETSTQIRTRTKSISNVPTGRIFSQNNEAGTRRDTRFPLSVFHGPSIGPNIGATVPKNLWKTWVYTVFYIRTWWTGHSGWILDTKCNHVRKGLRAVCSIHLRSLIGIGASISFRISRAYKLFSSVSCGFSCVCVT